MTQDTRIVEPIRFTGIVFAPSRRGVPDVLAVGRGCVSHGTPDERLTAHEFDVTHPVLLDGSTLATSLK